MTAPAASPLERVKRSRAFVGCALVGGRYEITLRRPDGRCVWTYGETPDEAAQEALRAMIGRADGC